MFSRLPRIVTPFAAVLGAYLAYSFAAVPFIEPSVKEREARSLDLRKLPPETAADTTAALLERWFSPDAWQRNDPTVLETDNGTLLIQEYKQLGDQRLELKPCTVILQASSDKNGGEKGDAPHVLLQAPNGAILDFDGPMNPARGQFGRLAGGTLIGPVTIRSPDRRPDAEDYLRLHTGNVQITQDRIVAPHDVEFQYGRSYGSGRDLIVTMKPDDDDGSSPQFGKLKTLELVKVHKFHVQLDAPDELSRTDRSKQPGEYRETVDMEVTCDGPFRYDFHGRVARFENQVKAWSPNADGPPDQLTCSLLQIYFMVRDDRAEPKETSDKAEAQDLSSLGIKRIVAEGSPAVLRAPSYAAFARGELLEFDFQNRRVQFRDRDKVMLRYRQNEVEVPAFEYRFAKDNRLGQLRADGPGVIRGVLPDDPSKAFEATWQERLILQPDEGDHALSLVSEAAVRCHGVGEFSADNLHVWLCESTRRSADEVKPQTEYRPISLLAARNVRIDSWHLSGSMQKAEVWIEYAENDARSHIARNDDGPRRDIFDSPRDANRSARKFDLQAQGLQLQLVQTGRDTEVEHLVINGNVRLNEVRTENPHDIPLRITGQTVQVDHANTPHSLVRVQGSRAEVAGRGLALIGNDIQLDRGKNRLWIPGPGKMTLPQQKGGTFGAGSSRLARTMTPPMTVTWEGQMDFDGRMAKFDRDVRVRGFQQTRDGEVFDLLLTGHDLDVVLTRRVDFSKEEQAEDLDVQQLAFRGAVSLRNDGSKNNRRTSHDRMDVRDLSIDALSGDLHASGPGSGSSVRYERSLPGDGIRRPGAANNPDDAKLVYVQVDFDDEIVGNIERREVEFRGRVRSVYGPVAAWDRTLHLEPRDGPSKGQLLLTCERLAVAEMGACADKAENAIELTASENATIEGKGFTAGGWRIKYAKAKELLILEGDGRNDAELWLKGSTAPTATAQRVLFWTNTHSYKIEGGRELNFLP